MKVYRATAHGFDTTNYIIAASTADEAFNIATNEDMGVVDYDSIWEVNTLQTNVMTAQIIEQF